MNCSIHPSVCHTFLLCSCHHIIMKFSGVNTINISDVHTKGQGQRSRSDKSKQILPSFGRFRTITPVPIHRWLRNDAQASRSVQEVLYCFLAATKQLYEWFSLTVCPSVCLSVTPFSLCFHHRIIIKFSGVITNDRSDVHAKDQGQRQSVKKSFSASLLF